MHRPIPEVNIMASNVPVVLTLTVSPTMTPEAQLKSATPKKRPDPKTLDVPPQAKHPRGKGSQVDVQNMTVAGVAISGTEVEDTAEYFDGHEDAGELLDPLVDHAETEEATKAKLKELDHSQSLECARPWTCTLLSGRSE